MLKKYIKEELTLEQIAKRLGCTKQNVCYHFRKHSLKRKPKIRYDKSLWTQKNLAWVAGLLEGEGSFCQGKITMQMHIRDIDVVYNLQHIIGGTVYGPYQGRDDIVQFAIADTEHSLEVCKVLYEYMGNRRKQQIVDNIFKVKGFTLEN